MKMLGNMTFFIENSNEAQRIGISSSKKSINRTRVGEVTELRLERMREHNIKLYLKLKFILFVDKFIHGYIYQNYCLSEDFNMRRKIPIEITARIYRAVRHLLGFIYILLVIMF
jgi:hypothetical protein